MLPLILNKKRQELLSVLCLGAHCDDIEIGCGGTILKLLKSYDNVKVHWVVFSSDRVRKKEAVRSADLFLAGAQAKKIIVQSFKNSFFPSYGIPIKNYFERLKRIVSPDIIFTHYGEDFHQDHRLISDLSWNTFRNHLIFEYEIPKYDGDIGRPNVFVPLEKSLCTKKVDIIMKCFNSQSKKHWFTSDVFFSFLRIRGVETGFLNSHAEGFYCRKIALQ